MGRPGNVYEYDAYPMPKVSKDRKPLPKDVEDKMIKEALERLDKKIEEKKLENSRKIS